MIESVVAGLIVALIVAVVTWLGRDGNRAGLWSAARRRMCRHDWRSLDEWNESGSGFVFVTRTPSTARSATRGGEDSNPFSHVAIANGPSPARPIVEAP